MPPPDLTHIQFAVVEALGARERSGEHLRETLRKRGIKQTLAAFYMMMKRLEDAGFVAGRYEPIQVGPYKAKERHYKVTGKGYKARESVLNWYGPSWAETVRKREFA